MIVRFAVSIAMVAGLAHHTYAVESSGISAFPAGAEQSERPWFDMTAPKNKSVHGSITVRNSSGFPTKLRIYPVDARVLTDGALGMLPEAAPRVGVGKWIALESSVLQLAPGQSKDIAFKMQSDANAPVGRHFGGIVIEPVDGEQGGSVRIVRRLGIRVYLTIPGAALPSATIDVRQRNGQMAVTLRNTGNTVLQPAATITSSHLLGRSSRDMRFASAIQPGSSGHQVVEQPASFFWQPVRLIVSAWDIGTSGTRMNLARTETTVWIGNPLSLSLPLALIGIIVMYGRRRYK